MVVPSSKMEGRRLREEWGEGVKEKRKKMNGSGTKVL
jgi:hypothetical protein